MPKRCARCGAFAGRGRELPVPGDWIAYLRAERDLSPPVGRLSMPLCSECYPAVRDLRNAAEEGTESASEMDRDTLLDDLRLEMLIDEGA